MFGETFDSGCAVLTIKDHTVILVSSSRISLLQTQSALKIGKCKSKTVFVGWKWRVCFWCRANARARCASYRLTLALSTSVKPLQPYQSPTPLFLGSFVDPGT